MDASGLDDYVMSHVPYTIPTSHTIGRLVLLMMVCIPSWDIMEASSENLHVIHSPCLKEGLSRAESGRARTPSTYCT